MLRLFLNMYNVGADASKPDWKVVKQFLLREGVIKKDHVV